MTKRFARPLSMTNCFARPLTTALALLGLVFGEGRALPSSGHAQGLRERSPGGAPRHPRAIVRVVPFPLVLPFLETTDAGLRRVSGALARMRALATEGSNGTLNSTIRLSLNQRFQTQIAAIESVALGTAFEDVPLLNGGDDVILQGASATQVFLDLPDARPSTLGVEDTGLETVTCAVGALNVVDDALRNVRQHRASLRAAWAAVQS